MKKGLMFAVCLIIVFSMLVVSGQLIKSSRVQYYTGDSVAVSTTSSLGANDKLCRAVSDETVKLFIVENKESWSGGESVSDVRGESSDIPNGKFSAKKVWESATAGSYDLVVDCNLNNNYDAGEPLYNQGFSVVARKGIGELTSLHNVLVFWNYDPEALALQKELLRVKASVNHEPIALQEVTLKISAPKLTLTSLKLYHDANSNGKIESDETVIGEQSFSEPLGNKAFVIPVSYTVEESADILVVAEFSENTEVGIYTMELVSLTGEGTLSTQKINFAGTPLSSSFQVGEKKSCLGEMTLSMPASARQGEHVSVNVQGVEGCDGKKVVVKRDYCYSTGGEITSCVIKDSRCEVTLQAVGTEYFACLDKNNDNDFSDFGESASASVTFIVEEVALPEVKEEEPVSNVSITGSVIQDTEQGFTLKNYFAETNPSLIVLEATLVLIFLVLVLIFFRIGNASEPSHASSMQSSAPAEESHSSETLDDEKKEKKVGRK